MEQDLAKMIDHTLLKPDATREKIKNLCLEAKEYQFASVCVHPYWVPYAYDLLKQTNVKVCTVIGFPLGATTSNVKAFETKEAIKSGAEEIDMVINIGALKSEHADYVREDIQAVTAVAKGKAIVKVIIETCLLTKAEIKRACQLAVEAGADYVKTSTGFPTGGATAEDVALMREVVGPNIGVKASGGVRTRQDAEKMIKAGASRIGASSGIKIVKDE